MNIQEEISVIHQTFDNATSANSENDMQDVRHFVKKFHGDTSNTIKKSYLHKKPSIYTTNDSLFSLQSFTQFKSLMRKGFIDEIDVDSLFSSLLKDSKKSLATTLSAKTTSYQIVSKKAFKPNRNYNGELKFSRVMFNKNRTKACYYFNQSITLSSGRVLSEGIIVFAEKKNGKWIYLKDKSLFIS